MPDENGPSPALEIRVAMPNNDALNRPGATQRSSSSHARSESRKPRSHQPEALDRDDRRTLTNLVVQHGQYYDSYLATEPNRSTFYSKDRLGLISFVRRGNYVLVGGGLIAPAAHRRKLLEEFVEYTVANKLHAAFHNINDENLPLYRALGFQITKWGEEPIIDLGECTWAGKAFEWVRRQSNFCRRHGLIALEIRPEELTSEEWATALAEVREVAAESLSTKPQSKQMRFFEGAIDDVDLGQRRLFVARNDDGTGRIEGFVICNPIQGGRKWSTELYRRRLDAVRGTIAYLFHHLLQQLQSENVEQVHMCLDIGRNIDTPVAGDSFLVRRGQSFLRRYTGGIFDFDGIHHFKSRFRPRYENRYVCTLPKATIGSLIAYLRVSGAHRINLWNLARTTLKRIRKSRVRKSLWRDAS